MAETMAAPAEVAPASNTGTASSDVASHKCRVAAATKVDLASAMAAAGEAGVNCSPLKCMGRLRAKITASEAPQRGRWH